MKTIAELGEKDVIVCRTEGEVIALEKLLHECGRKWINGQSYLKHSAEHMLEEEGSVGFHVHKGRHQTGDFYKSNYPDYNIIDVSEFQIGEELYNFKVIEDI